MDMVTEVSSLTELVVSLEQATQMAKLLPNTADPSHIIQIYSALNSAHQNLSSFLLSQQQSHHHLPPPPSAAAAAADGNFISSAVGTGIEPMQVMDDLEEEAVEAEQNSMPTIDQVGQQMRDCFIQNKRPKRRLSPSSAAAAEHRRSNDDQEGIGDSLGFDPQGTKLRALDLICQFHA